MTPILRLIARALIALFYRIEVTGRANIPKRSGAVLVSNHPSLIDLSIIAVAARRQVTFLLDAQDYGQLPFGGLGRAWPVIVLPAEDRPGDFDQAMRVARETVRAGGLVCVFAESRVSRIGTMVPFRDDLGKILRSMEAPIVPLCLDGLWGSIFSHDRNRFVWKVPRRIPYPLTVNIGKPMPSSTAPFEVRQAVRTLHTEAWPSRRKRMSIIPRAFVGTARRFPRRFAMADARVPRLSFGGALVKTVFLARRLRPLWEEQSAVGIALPPSVGGALVNYAAFLSGKVPVNLNYTLDAPTLEACAARAGLQTVITSAVFLARARIQLPCRVLILEEIAAAPRMTEKLAALGLAWLCPVRCLERILGRMRPGEVDDLATVIFSSGTTGDPKGVMLSHYNLISNAGQLGQVFSFLPDDRFAGILPFFHSFGFTATVVVPAMEGIGVVYHANPLEARQVGELVRRHRLTYMVATPAFLNLYLRGCGPGDFASLRVLVAGAEKLLEPLATAFEKAFGIRPLEGYGCTECSPVVAVNTRDFRVAGLIQRGTRRGTIGQPLPGISVRIVDPESRVIRPPGQPGLLEVRGPNVMLGYLNEPERTAEVLRDGWYVTGDIATLDEDGFLRITDRLSRFSKIGGEMVPHIKVEEKLHELAGSLDLTFVVTSVADEARGERLAVLHTLEDGPLRDLLTKLPQLELPRLWIPRPDAFLRVPDFPRLGTGKLDLRGIRELAMDLRRL